MILKILLITAALIVAMLVVLCLIIFYLGFRDGLVKPEDKIAKQLKSQDAKVERIMHAWWWPSLVSPGEHYEVIYMDSEGRRHKAIFCIFRGSVTVVDDQIVSSETMPEPRTNSDPDGKQG